VSDSLARLVLRAQGRLPGIEPLLPSRYAPARPEAPEWTEMTVETGPDGLARQQPEPPFREPRLLYRPVPAATEPARPAATAEFAAAEKGLLESPVVTPAARSASPAATAAAGPEQSSAPGQGVALPLATNPPVPLRPPTMPPAAGARDRSVDALPEVPVAEPARTRTALPLASLELVASPAVASPAVPTTVAGPPSLAARGTEAEPAPAPRSRGPQVSISIGRVDVYAVPARPAGTRAPPVRGQAASLADYLARRDGRAL
jgi:hypothetical protein